MIRLHLAAVAAFSGIFSSRLARLNSVGGGAAQLTGDNSRLFAQSAQAASVEEEPALIVVHPLLEQLNLYKKIELEKGRKLAVLLNSPRAEKEAWVKEEGNDSYKLLFEVEDTDYINKFMNKEDCYLDFYVSCIYLGLIDPKNHEDALEFREACLTIESQGASIGDDIRDRMLQNILVVLCCGVALNCFVGGKINCLFALDGHTEYSTKDGGLIKPLAEGRIVPDQYTQTVADYVAFVFKGHDDGRNDRHKEFIAGLKGAGVTSAQGMQR